MGGKGLMLIQFIPSALLFLFPFLRFYLVLRYECPDVREKSKGVEDFDSLHLVPPHP